MIQLVIKSKITTLILKFNSMPITDKLEDESILSQFKNFL